MEFENKIDRLFDRDFSTGGFTRYVQRLGVIYDPQHDRLSCQVVSNSDEAFDFAIRHCLKADYFRILTIEQAQQIPPLADGIPCCLQMIH